MHCVCVVLLGACLFSLSAPAQVSARGQDRPPSRPGVSLTSSRPQGVQTTKQTLIPAAISECDGDQCARGGGGAVWLVEGKQGQAMWHYGAIANLRVERFDGHTIVIHREDPNPSYSSPRYADPAKRSDGVFFADYTGTIHGDRIDGTVVWNGGGSGTWYATIPESICRPVEECPLDTGQMLQLGRNSTHAKLYSSALLSFRIAGDQGNADAQGLAGVMLRDGIGTPRDTSEALNLLHKSAEHNNPNAEFELSQTYEFGMGVPKDAQKAAYWKERAEKHAQQAKALQTEANAALFLMIIGVLDDLNGGPGAQGNSSHGFQDEWERQQAMYQNMSDACDRGEAAACDHIGRKKPEPQ
jgi:hypothetical protein